MSLQAKRDGEEASVSMSRCAHAHAHASPSTTSQPASTRTDASNHVRQEASADLLGRDALWEWVQVDTVAAVTVHVNDVKMVWLEVQLPPADLVAALVYCILGIAALCFTTKEAGYFVLVVRHDRRDFG